MEEARSIALAKVQSLHEAVRGLNHPESAKVTQHWAQQFHSAANEVLKLGKDPDPKKRTYVNGILSFVKSSAEDYPASILPPEPILRQLEQYLKEWIQLLNPAPPPRKEAAPPEENTERRVA